ncbi:MAG: hypothetical protein HQM08_02685 [Candidatus Riflebacteria bacterium]|nr:hypothetical protein [Candidatus Riflebacteria bacterium]
MKAGNSQNNQEKKTPGTKIGEIVWLFGAVIAFFIAYLEYTKKIPKIYQWINAHFYVVGIIGILGFAGEKIATIFVGIFLPTVLIGLTWAFKFRPDKFPINDWLRIYSGLVIFSIAYMFYIYRKWGKIKTSGKMDESEEFRELNKLAERVDPKVAAKYKREAEAKTATQNASIAHLTGETEMSKEQIAKNESQKSAESEDFNETSTERSEREARQIKEEFSRKAIKLSTTLVRIKNLAKTLDHDEIFSSIVDIVAKGLDGEIVQLLINNEKDQNLKVVRAEGMSEKNLKELVIPYSENSMITYLVREESGKVVEGGSLGVKECQIDPKLRGFVGQGVIKTILVAPIYVEAKLFALINVEKMRNPDYTRDDQNLIATAADIAGLVMKNARLYAATVDDLVSAKKISEEQLKRNEELKNSLTRIVSPRVAELIMQNPSGLKLGGTKSEVTMFFSDIRGFTKMSEGMDPTDIVEQLNVYFTAMTDILMEMDGTLDKYVGDELMALFGAPVTRPDDPIRAVLCGVKMLTKLKELHEKWETERKPKIQIGIGINTGVVTAGYMGSEKQLSYTVIGDNVNLASRVMANAKPMQLLITNATYGRVKDYFETQALEPIMVKGKSMPIEIFLVSGIKPGIDWATVLGGNLLITTDLNSQKKKSTEMKLSSIATEISQDPMKQNFIIEKTNKLLECRKCGTENYPQAKFCTRCGGPMD